MVKRTPVIRGFNYDRAGLVGTRVLRIILWCAATVLLSSCDYQPLSHERAAQIGEAVIAEVEGSHAGLTIETASNPGMTLYVDTSVSMNGYAHAPDTTFCKLVQRLAQNYRMPLHALSTELPPGKDSPPDYTFFQGWTNYLGTLDMADTITNFTKAANRTHLLVTDSQPWDAGDKPAYDSVADSINYFLSGGGSCALGLFRSSYRGFYSSPLLAKTGTNQVFYRCPNRPFAVWIFANPGSSASEVVKQVFAGGPSELAPFFTYEFAKPSVQLVLTNQELKIHGHQKIGDLALNVAGTRAERVSDFRSLRLSRRAIDSQNCANFQFDVSMPRNNGVGLESLTNGLRVSLDCWEVLTAQEIAASRRSSSGKASNKTSTNSVASPRPAASTVRHLTNYVSVYSLTLVTNTAAASQGRLVIRIPRPPGESRHFAWVVTLRRGNVNENNLVPAGVSTDNDTTPDKCGCLLNLSDVMGIVVRKTDKLGSLLFLTDYPR
jgi:hypothetical protein